MSAQAVATALDGLADHPLWVAWRFEERDGKQTKVPYSSSGRLAKANDPSTWDVRQRCDVKAQSFGGAVGIMLGDLGSDVHLVGIDLDSCIKDGVLSPWAERILAAIPSYAEVSPSGTGLKAFFYVETDNVRQFLELNGVSTPTQWGFSRSIPGEAPKENHGPGIELYTANRYFAVTGQLWPGQPDEVAILNWEALKRLAALIPAAQTNGSGANGKGSYSVGGGGADSSRSAVAMRKGAALKRSGKTFDEMVDALRADPETADWVREKGDVNGQRELHRIWEKVEVDRSSDPEIVRLARLSFEDYERERASAAKKLGYRKSVLDKIVEQERTKTVDVGAGKLPGRTLKLREFEPWPEPVNGPALLEAITKDIKNYVVMTEAQAQSVALWVIAAHTFNSFVVFPRLFFSAQAPNCGKTTALEVVTNLVPRALNASNISAAAMYRVIEQVHPSLMLDEADSFIKDNEDLRNVINAGHRYDGVIVRCVETKEDYEPREFSAWSPVAMAAIGHLQTTIEDRCIKIKLSRKLGSDKIQSLRIDKTDNLTKHAQQAARWVQDNYEKLVGADPKIPDDIINRAADNWRPLLAVADAIGGEWPVIARKIADELCKAGSQKSISELLLADIHEIFEEEVSLNPKGKLDLNVYHTATELFTKEILEKLHNRDDRPWSEFGKEKKPITAPQIANVLQKLGVKEINKTIRRGAETAKGYKREWLVEAFARYL